MDDEKRKSLRNKMHAYKKRLAVLEEQQAKLGVHTPAHVVTEIEDVQAEIAHIELQLGHTDPKIDFAALQQLRQQARRAYIRKDWEQAVKLLAEYARYDFSDEEIQDNLREAQRKLRLQQDYQAIRELRDEELWQEVLDALNELERKQPDYSDPDGLRRWAEERRRQVTAERKRQEAARLQRQQQEALQEYYRADDRRRQEITSTSKREVHPVTKKTSFPYIFKSASEISIKKHHTPLKLYMMRHYATIGFGIVALALTVVGLLILKGVPTSPSLSATRATSISTAEYPFANEVIPLTNIADVNSVAVQVIQISANAEFAAQDMVISETLSPATASKGVVTLINTIEQPFQLPAGTELIGKNYQGQEVHFMLDTPVTVPAMVSSTSLVGTSIQYGSIDVNVTARSPGSASNIAENAINQIVIPGHQPIISDSDSSNFLIRHKSISGGSDQFQRIVTDNDVERVMGDGLTGLYNAGVQTLRSKSDETKERIEQFSIYPDPQSLSKPENHLSVINPPVGQAVDSNNPTFSVTLKAHFSALATSPDQSINKQLETVMPQHFSQFNTPWCKSSEVLKTHVTKWQYNGKVLTVDGMIICTTPE